MKGKVMPTGIAILFLTVGLSSSAIAKGPESAVITGPGIDEPIELTIEAPSSLMASSGLWYAPIPNEASQPVDSGAAYTVLWMPHGVIQHFCLEASGGPVIHTPPQEALTGWGIQAVGWKEAPAGLGEALADIADRARPDVPGPAWVLPIVALAAIFGLVGLGRRLSH